MKKLLIIAIAVSTLAACTKDTDDSGPCATGTVKFRNLSNNTYKIYIDGQVVGTCPPNESTDKPFEKGKHSLKAEQSTGITGTPTVRTKEVDIVGCDSYEFAFP